MSFFLFGLGEIYILTKHLSNHDHDEHVIVDKKIKIKLLFVMNMSLVRL